MAEETIAEETSTETAAPAATAATPTAAPAAEAPAETRNARKVREGLVVSDKMDKTAVVAVVERVRHPKYGKFMMRTKKLYAHDETNDAHAGDRVRVMETRPLSKNKRWRVVEVLERAK
jgi:small subunit ribosomal protein S17